MSGWTPVAATIYAIDLRAGDVIIGQHGVRERVIVAQPTPGYGSIYVDVAAKAGRRSHRYEAGTRVSIDTHERSGAEPSGVSGNRSTDAPPPTSSDGGSPETERAMGDVPSPDRSHKPGDHHEYRIECVVCGQRGQVQVSIEPQRAS